MTKQRAGYPDVPKAAAGSFSSEGRISQSVFIAELIARWSEPSTQQTIALLQAETPGAETITTTDTAADESIFGPEVPSTDTDPTFVLLDSGGLEIVKHPEETVLPTDPRWVQETGTFRWYVIWEAPLQYNWAIGCWYVKWRFLVDKLGQNPSMRNGFHFCGKDSQAQAVNVFKEHREGASPWRVF